MVIGRNKRGSVEMYEAVSLDPKHDRLLVMTAAPLRRRSMAIFAVIPTARRIFAVHDDEIHPALLEKHGNGLQHGAASGLADDVAQE